MGYTIKISLLCLLVTIASAVGEDLVIKNADRTIDITSQLVRVTHRLTLSNNGKSAVNTFNFLVDANAQKKLSFFKAQVNYQSFVNILYI